MSITIPSGALGSSTFPHRKYHGMLPEIRYAHPEGDNTKDGLTWGTSKATIQAAIDALPSTAGGTIMLAGAHTVTSTIDLSNRTNLHVVGVGTQGIGLIPGQYPPATVIDGSSITTGAVFYSNRGGSSANHTWENLSVYGGRTAFHYKEAASIRFRNVAARPVVNDGNPFNTAFLIENTFWVWFTGCAANSPANSATLPSVILLTSSPILNAGTGLIRFQDTTFWGGSVALKYEAVPSVTANFYLENCLTENSSIEMMTITESGIGVSIPINGVGFRNCAMADSQSTPLGLVHLNASHVTLHGPVFENCEGDGAGRALKITAGAANGVICTGGWGGNFARYVVNAAGTATAGSNVSLKQNGFDVYGDDSASETTATQIDHAGALQRMGRAGETNYRHAVASTGKHHWGDGSTAYDLTAERSAANVLALGSNDALKTGAAVHASLPAATGYAAGSQFYCTTDKQPLWSDGTNWVEADGTNH